MKASRQWAAGRGSSIGRYGTGASSLVAVGSLLLACGPGTPAPTNEPPVPSASVSAAPVASAAPNDPFAVDGLVREEWLPLLSGPMPTFADVVFPTTPKNVPPPPPAECNAYVNRPTAAKAACDDKPAALALLDTAMADNDQASRDGKLAQLESCVAFDPGVIRSLRIEIGPVACGDALAQPVLVTGKGGKPEGRPIPGLVHHTLVGQALAALLDRTVQNPPKLDPPYTKARVQTFVSGPMFTWFNAQAVAVQELAKMGAGLNYYGKGIAAVAAGTADMRIVDVFREAPIPDEFTKNPELATAYYSALDEKLEQRKLRGRDAALAGLKELSHAGIISDPRTETARALLAKLFGGRRVDALDTVILPKNPAPDASTVEGRLAAALPTFYAGLLLDPAHAKEETILASLLTKGVPVSFRIALKDAQLSDKAKALYARARLLMGIRYWRAVDFDAAAAGFSRIPKSALTAEDQLDFGVALALRGGPDDVAALMQKEGVMPPDFGKPKALDSISDTSTRGVALFDGAVIAQVALPAGSESSEWLTLAKRYADATAAISDPALHAVAEGRRKAAEATAAAIAKK